MIFHVGEGRTGRGHGGNFDGCICLALLDLAGGLLRALGRVAHAVEAVFPVFCAIDGDKGVEALLCRHLVVAVRAVQNVRKAAVRLPEGKKRLRQGVPVLDKAAVVQRNAQLTQGHNDLRDGFRVRRSP